MAYDGASSSRVRGHSFYSSLAPFPIACFSLALMTDLVYWATAGFIWETMSVWLLTVGLVAAGLSFIAGIVDLVRSRTITGLGQSWITVAGHVLAFALSVVNAFVHSRDGYTAVVPEGLVLSFVVVLILLATTIIGRSTVTRTRVGGLA